MQYFLYILAIPFIYINYKIVVSDLKNKIIPNKYLLYLLYLIPFWWIMIYLVPVPGIEIINNGTGTLLFLLQIVLTFIISFILFYFNIWAAGDAKYLLVLSLFIPYIGIVPFIGNIALITILYLLGYFIYFYFGKLVFNKKYRQSLWGNIKQDLSETWKVHKGNKGGNTYKIITKFLLIFFIIFVSIRLSRIYLFNEILEGGNSRGEIFQEIIQKYNIYLIFLGIGIFIGGLYLFRLLINKFKKYIGGKLGLNLELIGNILIGILFILLSSFIFYELLNNYNEISTLLFRVFTLYLGIYLIFKILIYSYKITFGIAEYEYIDIKDLKEGDVVDKEYLVKMFGKQSSIGHLNNIKSKKEISIKKGRLLFPSPKNYFVNINNPINKKICKTIKRIYTITNKYNTEHIKSYKKHYSIKILNTFYFAPYILGGFVLTGFLHDKIFKNILFFLFKILNLN